MQKKIIIANWKMHAPNLRSWRSFRAPRNVDVVICPPFPYLLSVSSLVISHKSSVRLGAQDVFWEDKGAYTGEVSPAMLKNSKGEYVIVGHSERRRWLGETDEMINKKVKAVLRAGLKVILCVGEPLSVRKKGLAAAKKFVADQLRKDLAGIKKSSVISHQSSVIAYEPIWAIGTGRSDKPSDTAEMASFIKNLLLVSCRLSHVPVLYGGSVNSKNIADFVQYKEIDGALVGGASIKVGEFKKIVNVTSKI